MAHLESDLTLWRLSDPTHRSYSTLVVGFYILDLKFRNATERFKSSNYQIAIAICGLGCKVQRSSKKLGARRGSKVETKVHREVLSEIQHFHFIA
jgi:hypothetical protein